MDFQKLKLDSFQNILVTNAPKDIGLPFSSSDASFDCLLAFVQTEEQLDLAIAQVQNAGRDVTLVLAYPKGTSKQYTSEVNRDDIVKKIKADSQFRAPKLVSLDTDWSGFSFKYGPE